MTRNLDSAKKSRGINAKSITYFFHSLFNDVPTLSKFPYPLILVRLFNQGSLLARAEIVRANTNLYGRYYGEKRPV
jgi:hypothetical protein